MSVLSLLWQAAVYEPSGVTSSSLLIDEGRLRARLEQFLEAQEAKGSRERKGTAAQGFDKFRRSRHRGIGC